MLSDILKALKKTLEENSVDVKRIDFDEIQSGKFNVLSRPLISIHTETGNFGRDTATQSTVISQVTLTLVVDNIRNNTSRVLQVCDLRDAIINTLHHNKLGFELKNGLLFQSYSNNSSNIAGNNLQELGFHVEDIVFNIEYPIVEIEKPEDKCFGDIKSIVTSYFVNDDSIVDMKTQIDLNTIDGGTAYKESGDTIQGGSSKEEQDKPVLSGGKA
jgi:hypothetical protein